jgi:colanic acid biosynthesis glycosyl transferase WcaI
MRILFLTQWFQPESFFKGLPFAKALKEKGQDVEILTGFPNYPGGKLYAGYHIRFYQREVMGDVTVHRIPLYPSHDKSAFRRMMNYLSFSLSSILLGPWLIGKPDVIYMFNLITLGPTAFLLRLLYGSKIIIDVQDLWPESATNSKMLRNKTLIIVLNKICNWIYRKADCLTTLSPGYKQELIKRGVTPEKIEVIYNWCDEAGIASKASPTDSRPYQFKSKFVVLFAGTMGTAQGLNTLLDCAELCMEALPDIQFVLIGGGVERQRLGQRAQEMGLHNVTFLPSRPISQMGEVFDSADGLIVHLVDAPIFRIAIPSKTQAYLYIGKPIIMAMHGDAANLVRDAGAGLQCEPENPKAMMDAIRVLYEMPAMARKAMGEAGHSYYMEHLAFNHGVQHFERIMMSLSRKGA